MAMDVAVIQPELQDGSLNAPRACFLFNRCLVVAALTERGEVTDEPKILANLVLVEGSDRQKAHLFRVKSRRH